MSQHKGKILNNASKSWLVMDKRLLTRRQIAKGANSPLSEKLGFMHERRNTSVYVLYL